VKKKIIPTLLLLTCCFTTVALANDTNTSASQLDKVTHQIRSLQQMLSSAFSKKNRLVQELEDAEKGISRLSISLAMLHIQLEQQKTAITELEIDIAEQKTALAGQQQQLAKQLRSAYHLGKHDYLKLALNQQNPYTASRTNHYYRYINQARAELIQALATDLASLHQKQKEMHLRQTQLAKLQKGQQQQRIALQKRKHQRKKVIAQLENNINNRDKKLAELRANKQALEKVLNKINNKHRTLFKTSKPLYQSRGHLPWPTTGKITQHFGTQMGSSQLQYNGILISATAGQEVRAVAAGQVLFSDWLKGFGLLLIIDHGRGYMTLYAHNHSLYKHAGEKVNSGEIIASVGHSGGNAENGLYFELRHNGKPANPERWLS